MLDACVGDPRQQMGQERQTRRRQHRLGRREGQRTQSGALAADQDDGVHLCRVDRLSAVLSPDSVSRASDHHARACGKGGPDRPPQRRLPPPGMPISQESVGARMVGRQVAGRVAAGRMALVVQNLRRRHVDVLPSGLAEAITQVDVLHVHEVALVEARYLIERRTPQQQARAGQPADGAFAGLAALLAVGGRPRVGLPHRADHRVHAAPDQARLMPCRRIDRAVGIADQRAERTGLRPARGRLQQDVDAAGPPLHVGIGHHEELRVIGVLESLGGATFTAQP